MVSAPQSPSSKPKAKRPQQQAQQIARQIVNEPFEILKTANQQISGHESPQTNSAPQQSEPQQNNGEIQTKIRKERIANQSHMQAFQQELQEIKALQDQRQKERDELRAQEDAQKRQLKEQREEAQKNSPLEIVGKIKRGMLGGGKKGHVEKKQRSTELVKTPSN